MDGLANQLAAIHARQRGKNHERLTVTEMAMRSDPRALLESLVSEYAVADTLLKTWVRDMFPFGTVVQIIEGSGHDNWGIVTEHPDKSDRLGIFFENFNVWNKPVVSCYPVRNPRHWPKSIRRLKLRRRGYKFFDLHSHPNTRIP